MGLKKESQIFLFLTFNFLYIWAVRCSSGNFTGAFLTQIVCHPPDSNCDELAFLKN